MVGAVALSAVDALAPCFVGCDLVSEPAVVAVAPNSADLEPDADDKGGPLVEFVDGLVAVSRGLSAGLLRVENSPPEAVVAEDGVAELVAAPPSFPNTLRGATLAEVAVLAPASCAEVAGIAEGKLNAGFDEA